MQYRPDEGFARGFDLLIEAARDPKRDLATLLSETSLAIVVTDGARRILLASPAADFLFGYENEGLVGRLSDVLIPERLRQPDQAPSKPHEVPEAMRVEMPGVLRGGREETVEFLIRTVRWRGELFFITAMRGRGEAERALDAVRVSEDRLRRLVESLKDAVILLDDAGHVLTWNGGAARSTGYRADEVIGRTCGLFWTPEEAREGQHEKLLEIARKDGLAEIEAWRVRKDGTRFWANIVVTTLYDADGKASGFAKVTRDLTDQKRAEAERLQLAQAREAVRLRDEFLSIAAHELRTPLSVLTIQLQTLIRRVEAINEKTGFQVDRTMRAANRLSTLIDMLLDVSRITAGRLSLVANQVDVAALARDVVDQLGPAAIEAGNSLSVRASGEVWLTCDERRIEQVLINLLSNALRFAPGTPVELQVEARDDEVLIQVTDGGPGVPAADRKRIFERFEHSAESRIHGGLGLGLFVTAEIVTAHGGTVGVDAAPSGGAVFLVRLPRPAEVPMAQAVG